MSNETITIHIHTHTCPLCGVQQDTHVDNAVVAHDCPKNATERAKRKVNRKLTVFVRETPKVPGTWADELSESDQDHLFDMLAEDNLGATYEVV